MNENNENEALNKTDVMQSVVLPKDLRIGNYLLIDGIAQKILAILPNDNSTEFKEKEFFKIIFQHWKYETSYEIYSDEEVELIPLTEEWISKLGFEKDGIKFVIDKDRYHTISLLFGKITMPFIKSNHHEAGEHFSFYGIRYVHQLQNLYFALTGRELTVA